MSRTVFLNLFFRDTARSFPVFIGHRLSGVMLMEAFDIFATQQCSLHLHLSRTQRCIHSRVHHAQPCISPTTVFWGFPAKYTVSIYPLFHRAGSILLVKTPFGTFMDI